MFKTFAGIAAFIIASALVVPTVSQAAEINASQSIVSAR